MNNFALKITPQNILDFNTKQLCQFQHPSLFKTTTLRFILGLFFILIHIIHN